MYSWRHWTPGGEGDVLIVITVNVIQTPETSARKAWEGMGGGLSALHDVQSGLFLKTTHDVQLLRASPGRSQRLRPALGLCHERWETSF